MKKNIKKLFFIIFGIFIFCILLIQIFNRTPHRNIPEGNTIVSPANGQVIDIETEDTSEVTFLKKGIKNILHIYKINPPYTVIVIEMNLRNIHAQRSPIFGKIVYQKHFSGLFKNALFFKDKKHLVNINEKELTIIKGGDVSVGVVQVAGITARRIENFKFVDDFIKKGDIYGRIKLGSQVVLILPEQVSIKTKVGDIVIDGESVLGEY